MNLIDISQNGSSSVIEAIISGSYNELTFLGTASNITYTDTTDGDYNITNITMGATGGSVTQNVTGDSNQIDISQTTNSILGSEITLNVTGSSNIFDITQSGTDQQILDLMVEGNNGTYTINQSN